MTRLPFRWYRWPPVQLLLYLALRAVAMVAAMFPYAMAPQVGRWLGRAVRLIDRRHSRIAVKNLERSRGICPADETSSFVDRVYGHIGTGFVEMLMERRQPCRRVRLERFEGAREALARGRGLIVVIGHLGNWELVGRAVALAGYPIHSLARPVENPRVDRYLNRFRTRTGQRIIPREQALGSMIRVLRSNEMLIIQLDQDARRHGVHVDFLGRPASTHRSPALLSLKYGAPVVVADIHREGPGHFCILSDPIYPEPYRSDPDPVKALTQAYTRLLESYVRAHPEQWFWVHDRWRTPPPADPGRVLDSAVNVPAS